jgi:DNA-binding NtrC family response regulator
MENERTTQKGKARILVVDDNLILRELMETILLSCGHSCVSVEDGLAAINLLKNETFDMVISDIEMPRLNGFELLSHVKNKYPGTKVIMISGKYRPDSTIHGLPIEDAHHFLAKPFSVSLFLSTVDSVLISPDPYR